jgi:hypothetical protein
MREKMNIFLYRRWPFEGKKENRFSISALKICIGKCRQANSNLIVFFLTDHFCVLSTLSIRHEQNNLF